MVYAVRHGQSTANAAFLDPKAVVPADDGAISLTELGGRQAGAVGLWLAGLPDAEMPDMVWCSPYLRAVQTWEVASRELGPRPAPCYRIDSRLRDRYRGQLSHLRPAEVRERFPEEYAKEAADSLGYRPPDGESFLDVAERLRDVVTDIEADRHRRVLIVAHDAVVLFLRMILEKLTHAEVLTIADGGLAGNASVTSWHRSEGAYRLVTYDDRTHLKGTS
ncbi:histidine phosphatase family protein [Acrocarpospora catenulata]|uniref:histidine phosphatase family protein n=1 Tax=Acrocarpospora catenulata TaxID=2836182 RepID=UPI001BD95B5F|nr:histidine phosphatase family protein [Acrocarpospora catenulata]